MNSSILHKEVQDFIDQHLNSDISKLIFKGSPFEDVSIQELAEQIESKKKTQQKLPTWFKTKNIYYPNKLNIEQTSSEITANYKATLISGNSIIDLTGGFGIDAYYFSKQFKNVTLCEINNELSSIVEHNYKLLEAGNISVIHDDGLAFLKSHNEHVDWIYIDPSRRNDSKGKVFLLNDCLPNIPEKLELLFEHTNNILIKASPMLDISNGISELKFVKEVHVVAAHNEVKELLFVLEKSCSDKISIHTVNIFSEYKEHFKSEYKNPKQAEFSLPLNYLYEPNSAILKAGLFNEVSHKLKIYKLHNNSHLYTSKNLVSFPGRKFEIIDILPYNNKVLKKQFKHDKANITTRNFPETIAQIQKKTKLKDGGDQYLFFTTDINNKHIILICKKV